MADQDLGTTIKFTVDATGVEAGTTRVKRSLKDVGKTASEVGKQTGDAIGGGGDEAAKKIEAATRRISNEFKRLQIDAASMGKSLSEKIVIKADAYGIPRAAIEEQRAALKAFEDAQRAANPAMVQFQKLADASGTSVKGLSASLKQVPAQFTDIIVSLQGGQAPLTVLLQQGGQLKDTFGGIAPAVRALGGYVATLINPFTLAAGAVGTLGYAYYSGSKELDAYRKTLILTGNAVGLTSGQLSDMARSMAAVGGTQSAAAEALAEFVNAGAAGAGSLEKFTASAIAFEKATGTAVSETAKQFASLGEKPLEASIKLNESTNFLTLSLYEQIKALEEQGKHTEAAKVAQNAYSDTLDQNTAIITANLGHIERGWLAIVSAGKAAIDNIKSVGRDAGPEQQAAALREKIINKENDLRYATESSFGGAKSAKAQQYERELKALKDQESALSKTNALSAIRAADRAIEAKQLQARAQWDKEHENQVDKLQTARVKEIADFKLLQLTGQATDKDRENHAIKLRELTNQQASALKSLYADELRAKEKPKSAKVERFGNELTAAKQWLSTQEGMIRDSYNAQQKAIEDSYKAQEISAAQYYARLLASDAESLQQREQIRADAQARFDAEMAKRVAVTQARPESKAKSTALADLENEAKNFAAAQEAARQKDINSMAKHSSAMAVEIDKESKKVTGSVDAYIADMQRKAESDATLQAAREAMVGQAPEIIAGMEAELKVRADAAKMLDQTAQAYADAAKEARKFEETLADNYDDGIVATKEELALLETLQSAAIQARKKLLQLGGAVDTGALEASITATAASIKAQTDKLAGDITKTLADGIMSAGKDGGEGLRKALEDVLVTRPFRIVVEAMLQPVSSAIAQGIMGQSLGAGAAGAGGISTALNSASLAVSSFGSTLIGTAANVATGGATLAQTWAAGSAMMSTTGGTMAGIAMKIGAAAPYIAAAAVAANVLSNAIDRANGSVTAAGTFAYGHNSATGFKTGGRADFIQDGGGGTHLNQEWFDPGEATSKYMSAIGDLVTKSVKGWAAAIGLSADAVNGYTETVQAAIGNGMSKAEERQSIDKAMAGYGDAMVQSLFGQIMAFAKSGETPSGTLERMGNDVTAVNNILRDNGHQLYDTSFESAKAVQVLIDSVGGLDKFTALASTLGTVNNVLSKLGKDTFELSMDGAQAANDLAKSVGGTAKLSELADGLIHVNENLAKLGEPLLDISVASAQAAHSMLTATDSAVKAMEAAEKLEASYASFAKNLSKDPDTTQVASLQAIFDRAMANVTKFIPSIKGQSDLTSVTYDQYTGYTDPQRTKLDAAASAFKDLQTAIDSAAKTAESAAKTAQDAAEAASKAYEDALKSVEDSTRDVNRQLRDFGKTDFQKKLSAISDGGQDKQAELDKLSTKATELSVVASDASLKATAATLGTVSTISGDLIKASTDLSSDSQEVADNIKTTLANSTAALGDALTLAPAISDLFDSILAGLLKIPPALILVSGAVQGVGSAASNASGGLTAFGAAAGMAGSSATSATGPVNSVGAAFTAVAPSAAAAGAALSALGAAFDAAGAALTVLTATFGSAAGALDGLNAAFGSAANGLGSLGSAFESAGASGASLAGSLGAVSGAMAGIAGAAAGAAGGIAAAVSALSSASSTAATVQVPSATSAAAPAKLADGGYIRGAGTTTSDSIPAMLSDKEFVVRASSVAKYGTGFLDAINAGVLPKTVYREGGTPASGAVGELTSAQKQVVYLDTFSSFLTRFGGVLQTLDATGKELTKAVIKLPESYSDALGTLNSVSGGKDFTGMDSESVSKFFRDLMANNAPTYDGKTWSLSPEAQAALAPFANAGASIDTLLSGLKEREGWQDKLDVLTGKTTERELALKKDLASTTDIETQNIIKKVYAQEDLNKAREAEAEALKSVQDALTNFMKESSSLEADLNSAFGTSAGDSAAKTIRKDFALADVRQTVADAGLLQSSPTYAAMSPADKLKTNAAIQGIRDTALLAEKQYDLNEARKEEIKLLTDSKSRLKSLTDSGASKQVDRMRLLGDDAGADKAQEAIDLADVYKSTADATALLATEGLTPLDKAAIQATITTNDASIAQYARNKALDAEIEILGRYKSAKEDADSTNIELMKAMGNTAGAAALELANATKGFTDAQIATVRQTNATKALIAAYGNLSSTADMVTNSRIGLARAKGDTAGADALQREFDIKPYVTAIADATAALGTATTQAEKDSLNLTIATNKGAIGNYDLSKSLDKEAQAATDAKAAADALASSYADLKKQIENANIELLRTSGDTAAADEAAMALALRDHAGDAYYESLYRELLTIQKLTAARQQLNTLEDSALQKQIALNRANWNSVQGNVLSNRLERSAALQTLTAPATAAKAELDRSNMGFVSYAATLGYTLDRLNAPFRQEDPNREVFTQKSTARDIFYGFRMDDMDKSLLTQDLSGLLEVFHKYDATRRTPDQKSTLQGVVDTASGIAAAYDLNKSLEGQLKIIELQDEAYKQNLDAQKNLADAQKSYADVLKSTISTMRDFIATLDGGASPVQNLSTARANFQSVASKAATGDTSAYKDLTPAARTFLDLSKNYSKSLVDYQRDEAKVRTTLNAVITANQRELDKLPQEISKAADPTKDAWIKLQEATLKETNTSIMLTALGVDSAESKRRLRTAEESLADRYVETIYMLDEAKRTPLLTAFNDALTKLVDTAVLPEYTAFDLGDIWGTKIAGVLPKTPLSNTDLNRIIADKFPGLLKSDFHVPLSPDQLAQLLKGKFPTLTKENLISVPANMVELVNAELAKVFTPNFAGPAFDAKQMMQDAINKMMAAAAKPNIAPDTATTAVNKVQEQAHSGGSSGTGTSGDMPVISPPVTVDAWMNQVLGTYASAAPRAGTIEDYLRQRVRYSSPNVYDYLWESAGYAKQIGGTEADLLRALNSMVGFGDTTTAPRLREILGMAGIPKFAAGTNLVPHDMIAQIHKDEAIIPAPFNPAKYGRDSGNNALVAEIKALRAEVENLRKSTEAGQNAIAANTGKTARVLTKFDIDGLPEART